MARLDFALICREATRDHDRRLSIVGVGDRLLLSTLPATMTKGVVVVRLRGEPGEPIQLQVVVKAPNGERIPTPPPYSGELSGDGEATWEFPFEGVTLKAFGAYPIEVFLNERRVQTLALQVMPIPNS